MPSLIFLCVRFIIIIIILPKLNFKSIRNFQSEMSEQRSVTPTAGRAKSGVGADADVEHRTGINVRVGATFMKSVSIFLTSGRKASANSKRHISAVSGKDESRRRHRRKMPEGGSARNSAYIVKVIESLKKKTRFSRRVCRDIVQSPITLKLIYFTCFLFFSFSVFHFLFFNFIIYYHFIFYLLFHQSRPGKINGF